MKTKLALILLFLASSALAAPSRDELKWFAGNWRCTGTDFAGPAGPEHKSMANVTVQWALNGMWLDLHYTEVKTAENAHPFAINAYWGYDQETKKIVGGYVDNTGGYGTEVSDGWMGDRFVFEGPMHAGGMTGKARDTFIKKGANELEHIAEFDDKGTWKKATQEICKH